MSEAEGLAADATARTRARREVGELWGKPRWGVFLIAGDAGATTYVAAITAGWPVGFQVSTVMGVALVVPAAMSYGAFVALIPFAARTQRDEARTALSKRTATDDRDLLPDLKTFEADLSGFLRSRSLSRPAQKPPIFPMPRGTGAYARVRPREMIGPAHDPEAHDQETLIQFNERFRSRALGLCDRLMHDNRMDDDDQRLIYNARSIRALAEIRSRFSTQIAIIMLQEQHGYDRATLEEIAREGLPKKNPYATRVKKKTQP